MGNVGRFFCVALPFVLLTASIICFLIAGLTGVTSNSLYMFEVNTTDLSISSSAVEKLISSRDVTARQGGSLPGDLSDLTGSTTTSSATAAESSAAISSLTSAVSGTNITGSDLGLAKLYDVNLWGYCSTPQEGKRNCTKAKFNWAATYLNTTSLTDLGSDLGANITLPSEITDSLKVFKTVTKWTEVVFVIGMIALGVELLLGIFTSCSRAMSCLTWLVSGIASVAVIGAAGLMTAMSVVVIGAVDSTAKWYGVKGKINTSFLAVIWLGVAFALGAAFFWLFSICCCKPDRYRRSGKRYLDESDKQPLATGAYAPLPDRNSYGYNNQMYNNQTYEQSPYSNQTYGEPPRYQKRDSRTNNLAYEPYSHSNV